MKCKTCVHRKWVQLKTNGGNWTICGCTKLKLRFGNENDVKRNKDDKERGIMAMPHKCGDYEAVK